MLDFIFYNPTKIIFGRQAIKLIAPEIPAKSKVMITYGSASAKRHGVLDKIKEALNGYDLTQFGGIEPNPEYEILMKGMELAREKKIDFLLAIGGGSVIDGTKFMAAAIPFKDNPALLLANAGSDIKQSLPIGTVVTLPASGSEMNNRAVISRKALQIKQAILNDILFPRFSVLDPTITFTLPAKFVGNGVVDTFVHVLEQYMTYPVNGKVQDRLAEGLLLMLIEEGPRALAEPEDYDVRANLMWGATLGLNGLLGAGVPQDWAAHRSGYELTVLYGLDHAQTLACLVPAMLKIRAGDKKQKLLQYAERVWGINSGDEDARINEAINKTRKFFESMGLPTRLSDYGIKSDCIPRILGKLKEHGMVNLGERKDVTPEMMQKILENCL
ncbi:MAG: aldehyde reductase [Deltaproteobacteria bacterium RBG_19FT_COMBO_43_11]|nr:MAG: aldehyde reductase [Deltaproteobacteria bacterium RBG_19FT_COMBO_43_11]